MIAEFQGAFRSMRSGLDVLYVLEGIKPCARLIVKKEEIPTIADFLQDKGLHHCLSDFKIRKEIEESTDFSNKAFLLPKEAKEGEFLIYIAKDLDIAERAKQFEQTDDQNALGKILGYPNCCIDFYLKHLAKESKRQNDFILPALKNSDGYIFNSLLNHTVRHMDISLLSHFPCCFSCLPSLQQAEQHFAIIKKHDEEVARIHEGMLKGVVLYTEQNGIFLLREPEFNQDAFSYKTLMASVNNEVYKTLKQGDTLEIVDKHNLQIGKQKIGGKGTGVFYFT